MWVRREEAAFGTGIKIRLKADRQQPNADAGFLEHGDAAAIQRIGQRGQIGDNQSRLSLRPAALLLAQQDEGWLCFMPQRQERCEIGIGGNDDPIFGLGAGKDYLVPRRLQTVVANMNSIMSSTAQFRCDNSGQRIIDQKSHGTVRGRPRSRTASAA